MTEEELKFALAKWGTRESAVELPHGMNVSAYLMKELGIPKLWQRDDLIYHYTDAAGLRGILKDRVFWATKAPFLNDPTEARYAVDVVARVLRERSEGSGREAEVAAAVLKNFNAPEDDIYVASFCRDGDLLSQWRGYGAFGEGYALGFSFPLGKAPPIQISWLIEVLYDERPLADAVNEILSIFVDYLSHSSSANAMRNVAELFPEALHVLWLSLKNPAYKEEQEVRLLAQRSSKAARRVEDAVRFGKIDYRTNKADIIPFLKIGMSFPNGEPMPLLPLRRIVVGPGVRFERSKDALEQMLDDYGYSNVEISPSRVPFAP